MAVEILNIDCMEYMAGLPDGAFDLAIVDPPYGIDINKSGRLGAYGGSGKSWDNYAPNSQYFSELFRVAKNAVIWGGNYFGLPPCKCFLIWDKLQPEGVSFASCEFAWTSFDGSAKTFRQSALAKQEARIHPTQKPVRLYSWILSRYAKPGWRILDTHLGSGSSAIAAHYAGHDFVGCELDKDYYEAARRRIANETAQLAMF